MKFLRVFITFLLIVQLLATSVLAAAPVAQEPVTTDAGESEVMPCVEETQWYYTVIDGVIYKRLWSITYDKWLTEWEPAY